MGVKIKLWGIKKKHQKVEKKRVGVKKEIHPKVEEKKSGDKKKHQKSWKKKIGVKKNGEKMKYRKDSW